MTEKIDTRVIQVTNVAPTATREQMKTLFSYIGRVRDIKLYPPETSEVEVSARVCYVEFDDTTSVGVALHLSNIVFIDRAIIAVPVMDGKIPDENTALQLTPQAVAGMLPGAPTWPSNVVSRKVGSGSKQMITTYDPRLVALGLPQYPPLPASIDPSKTQEIRRTVYVGNLEAAVLPEQLLSFFSQVGEVKYIRMAGGESSSIRYAFVEFSDQRAVATALTYNGVMFQGRPIQVSHSTAAIIKPQSKSAKESQREIEEAMKKVKEAHSLIAAAADSRRSRSSSRTRTRRRSRSRSKGRSRSRSRKRSRSRSKRSRSRSKRASSRSRRGSSRSRRRSRSRHRSRSKSRSRRRRSHSRSRRNGFDKTRMSRRSRSRERRKSKSRSRTRSKRSRSRSRKRSRTPPKAFASKIRRSRSRSRSRKRSRSTSRDRSKDKKKSISPSPSPPKLIKEGSLSPKASSENGNQQDTEAPSLAFISTEIPILQEKKLARSSHSRSPSPIKKRSPSLSPKRRSPSRSPKRASPKRRRSKSPKKSKKSRRSSRSRSRSGSRHRSKKEKKKDRDRSKSRERSKKKKVDKERERERDREEKSSKDLKVVRDYDEEEKGYSSGGERERLLASIPPPPAPIIIPPPLPATINLDEDNKQEVDMEMSD